ncbi:MAG: potassium transporter TrkG [Flavobacteriales bacterium]|nr:potassium transporter TrkG [Flavobacteriales bacterium]
MSWQQIRERINLYLFKNKERTLGVFKVLNMIVTLLAIATILWMYGFPMSLEDEKTAFTIIKGSFIFYVIHYLTKIIYDFNPRHFIRSTWFEGLIMLVLIIEGLSFTFFGKLITGSIAEGLGITYFADISTILVQLYFLIIVITEFLRNSEFLPRVKLNPAFIFVMSFVFIITGGTLLLMLPQMTIKGDLPFVDALFTATSATCVTGLMTIDPHDVFTFKGQFVILMLIKIGGLNIIAFGGFLALAAKFGVGVRHHQVIEGFVNKDNILSAKGMLGKVILWTTAFETLGAILMYYLWKPTIVWLDNGEKIFYSIFHSISAFNNAGISLFTNGFINDAVVDNYLVHWVVIFLIFFGSLGILSIFELFEPAALRDRLKFPWKRISFSTKIALYFSLGLILIGAIMFFMFEQHGTLANKSFFGQITGSFFQSVSPRTAGYNTVDFAFLSVPSIMTIMALMYIGASSSSTGGGIKTSSLAIIWADVRASMTGREHATLFKRTVSASLKSSAYSIAIMYIVMNFIGALLLCTTEGHILAMPGRTAIDLVFEQVSAFSTVGLSTGVTALLTDIGKYILTVSMFVGRVGTFTIAFALAGRFAKHKFRYPEGETLVG